MPGYNKVMIAILGIIMFPMAIFAQPSVVPHKVDKAVITDKVLIREIAAEMYITVDIETVEKMEIIDITGDGFGKNDIAKVFPSERFFQLSEISDELEEEMGSWKREAAGGVVFENLPADEFREIYNGRKLPQYLLLANIGYALEQIYGDSLPIELYYSKDTTGIIFHYWGYVEDSLVYRPGKRGDVARTTAYDLMYVLKNDTTVVVDTTMYDIMFIYKTLTDTVYLPGPGKLPQGRGPINE
ncbi:MAG: hypothetical protein GF307_02310 [candidate division Zixibacteria bacterium]|nr:hypothetical protein [candidate division Zixibacteria bacterium]